VSNERSAKAIVARDRQSDTSTYHYGDNLSRAIRALGKKLVNLIPNIYDAPDRVARTIGLDGTEKMVKFDSTQPAPVTSVVSAQDPTIVIEKIYNPTIGKYDVAVITGKGYATKRQEALESMAQLIQTNPELWKIAGDLFVKQMDWPGAHELAKRFEKTIPPELLSDDDPQMQKAKQIIQQMQQELQQAHQMLNNAQNSIEAREVTVKEFEARIKAYQAETQRIVALKPAQEPGLSEEQIQDIAAGTVHAALQDPSAGGMMGPAAANKGAQQPQEGVDQTKLMQEVSKHVLQGNQHDHEARMAQFQAAQAAQQPPQEGQ